MGIVTEIERRPQAPGADMHLPLTTDERRTEAPIVRAVGNAVTRMCLELQDHFPAAHTAATQREATRQAFFEGLKHLKDEEEFAELTVAQIIDLLDRGRRRHGN